ncbi:hypothetical protein AAT19DRAFT_14833 [Rhodotorula toruloides]|uniref:Uncharacterized protein n=1 Tax=Rhodotorula toruloides TaxID=5286 RepID=A0A2T0A8Y3_RHOTO|nr:hypothetical protein AAT19DRAFT_14833 [Rhodotorula toruloides]
MGWTGRLCAEAVLLEQALQRMQPEVNIDDQLREKLFDDLHDLGTCAVPDWYQPHFLPELGVRASRWPEIMTKLQNPATILRLPSLPPSFFDALRDRDPAFDLAFRIAEDERVIRSAARRRRQYDPDYPLEIGECVELLVREFGVEEERAKSLLAVLPPSASSSSESGRRLTLTILQSASARKRIERAP